MTKSFHDLSENEILALVISSIFQVVLGGALVFVTGILIGSA
jgi:hypothetical protein